MKTALSRKIGRNIRKYREYTRMNQTQLAEKLRVTQTQVSHWERGRNEPRVSVLLRIAVALDVTVNDLLS